MNKRIKLLIINRDQFGYHIDTYYYCKYLAESFDITYICWNYKHPFIEIDGVDVVYIDRNKNKVSRYLNFIFRCIVQCKKHLDIVFIVYFPLCAVVKLFAPKNKYIVDIRTGYLIRNNFIRFVANKHLCWEANLFKNITIISSSLLKKLGLNKSKTKVIPLGADVISTSHKILDDIRLLYVGTFHRRNLEQTIRGVAKFHREYKERISISYIIIGFGYKNEEDKFASIINEENLQDLIELKGKVKHGDLQPYFDKQNIGVSFVPITPYFDCQPPTKTFDYMLSGMPVIATSTYENSKVINSSNGVLIYDSADSFYEGLKKMARNLDTYNSDEIRSTCERYKWEYIIQNDLKNYLLKV